jgi:hypothetical protein
MPKHTSLLKGWFLVGLLLQAIYMEVEPWPNNMG